MRHSTTRALLLATAIAAIPVLASPAFAQDSTEGAEDSGGVREIVVTAQRQSQSVLAVPLSISAISGDQLADSGIRQMSDLQMTTPGFVPSNSSGYNQMFIRGIGNSIFVGADPSVATFIDDVPRVFGTLVNNFVDVERVEVIKGAPGALYGRNATGGAVNIITRQPNTEALAGTFRGSYGTKNTWSASAFLNVPLSDSIAWTVSAEKRKHDSYVKNLTRDATPFTAAMFPGGSYVGDAQGTADFFNSGLISKKGYANEDFWAVSSKLLVRAGDNFKITFAGDYSKKDDDNGNGLYQATPAVSQGGLVFFLTNYAGATPNLPANFFPTTTRKFTTAQRGPGFVKLDDYGFSATAVLNLDNVDLTSITSYRKNHSDFFTELGFNPVRVLEAHVDIHKKTFYQELRAVSTGDGPLQYIAGASYLRAQFDGGLKSSVIPPLVVELPISDGGYVVKNWSAYAQLGYDLTENLSLTVSGRYIHEKNSAHFQIPASPSYSQVEKKFLPSATLSYKLNGGGNIYARWARGFKAGGVNPVAPPALFPDPSTQGGIFKGETVDTFEAGVRTPLADHKVQLTAAVFYNDYKNVQVGAHARPAYAQVAIAIVNAGSARTYGAEMGVTARVADPLTLGASVGYLNAKYKSFSIPVTNPVLEPFNLDGGQMTNAPKWQMSFTADLDQPLNDSLRLVGNVTASHTSELIWLQSGLPGVLPDAIGPAYWLVNARLGVRTQDEKYELAVYAKNLFNAAYTTYGSSSAATGNVIAWGDPRIVGIEGTVKF